MNYTTPYFPPCCYRINPMQKSYKTLDEALTLIREAIVGEMEDELFYDYLITTAPTSEDKDIIKTIRDDERKHNKFFRAIYRFYSGQNINSPANIDFQKPSSYIEGIKKAKLGELRAVERYRDIRAGIPDRYYRDMVFEIITDELKHAHKYDYILYLDLENKLINNTLNYGTNKSSDDSSKYRPQSKSFCRQAREFTLNELAQYDGAMGRPAYVAVNGIVYDVSNEATWGGGTHFGLIAGKDLTAQYQSCHGIISNLEKLPTVGILKS